MPPCMFCEIKRSYEVLIFMPKANLQYNFLLRKTVGKESAGNLVMEKKMGKEIEPFNDR